MATAGFARKTKQGIVFSAGWQLVVQRAAAQDDLLLRPHQDRGQRQAEELLLGGKGANLAEMTSIGLPVPPGFTITTEVCDLYYKSGRKLPAGLMDEVANATSPCSKRSWARSSATTPDPLLVSVRSGAAVSMPGMMNTILNLGLNDEAVVGIANATGNQRFAYDAYRRLINMYGDVVCGVDHEHFEARVRQDQEASTSAKNDTDVPLEGMVQLCEEYKKVFKKHFGKPFPQDPIKQLELAIEAVFKSWMQPRAVTYRQVENITGLLGTAVNVQSMVFGNMGDDSGTGVAFTRDPATGENKFYGEFLVNAQGEDVVAGIRTPLPVAEMPKWNKQVSQAAARDQGQARTALPRRAGHRVHDRKGHAVHAADPQRQADRRRRR